MLSGSYALCSENWYLGPSAACLWITFSITHCLPVLTGQHTSSLVQAQPCLFGFIWNSLCSPNSVLIVPKDSEAIISGGMWKNFTFMRPECFPFKLDVGFHIFLVLCIVPFFSGLIISFFDLVFCLFASKLWCPYSSVEFHQSLFHLHCIFAVKLTSRNSCGAHWQGIWFNYVLVDRLYGPLRNIWDV